MIKTNNHLRETMSFKNKKYYYLKIKKKRARRRRREHKQLSFFSKNFTE